MIYLLPLLLGLYLLPIKNNKLKFSVIFTVFLVISLVRYGFGADYFAYGYIYETLNIESIYHTVTWQMRYEPLFKLMLSFFKKFNIEYTYVLSILSAAIFSLTSFWIYRNSKKRSLSLFMYISMFYLVWSLSGLRQAVSLTMGLFILFDKKSYSLKTQVISILILSLFHYSAAYLLLVVLFNLKKFNKKQMLMMISVALIASLLPLKSIIEVIPFIPFKAKILYYFQAGKPFLQTGYLIRAFFTLFLVLNYDYFETINKKYLDNILFGFATYFFFSFSPTAAGRLSVYTYVLLVILIPSSIDSLKFKKIAVAATLVFSSTYFLKEIRSNVNFSGMADIKSFPTLFNQNEYTFNKYDYYLLEKRKVKDQEYSDFLEKLAEKDFIGHDEEKMNFIGWNPLVNGYSIFNIEGDLSINYNIKGSPKLYNDVLVNEYDSESLFSETRYIDVVQKNRTEDELIADIQNYEYENQLKFKEKDKKTNLEFNDLPKKSQEVFLFPEEIKNFEVFEVNRPFKYYVIKSKYYFDTVYAYLDENLEPLSNKLFSDLSSFDGSQTMVIKFLDKTYRINKDGESIWIQ